MKIRRVATGGVIVLSLGMILGSLTGIYLGFSRGGGSGDYQTSLDADSVARTVPASETEATPKADIIPASQSSDVLDVVIDGTDFYVVSSRGDKPAPISLEDLVNRAKQTTGNEDGIRVRISRRFPSRLSAENRLDAALKEAGLSPESIHMREEVLPE